jgi:hypothetical protein
VPYGRHLEDLFAVLHDSAPEKAEAVVLQRRRVEYGLLSVGLKIPYRTDGAGTARVDKSAVVGSGLAARLLPRLRTRADPDHYWLWPSAVGGPPGPRVVGTAYLAASRPPMRDW